MSDGRESLEQEICSKCEEDVKAIEFECIGCVERGDGFAIAVVRVNPVLFLKSTDRGFLHSFTSSQQANASKTGLRPYIP